MAKKRGRPKGSKNKVKPKVYGLELKTGWKQPKPKPRAQRGPKLQCVLLHTQLRPIIREAVRAGLVEAIEHTSNFWDVSHGYKKYIEQQIELQSEALMAAVKTALRQDRELRENASLRRKR